MKMSYVKIETHSSIHAMSARNSQTWSAKPMGRNFKTKIIYFLKKYRNAASLKKTVKKKKVGNNSICSLHYNCLNKTD